MTGLEWSLLILVGAAGGFLAGLLGVGGGIIFIPVLTFLFVKDGIPSDEVVKYTLANSIFLVFVSGISGILRQSKTKTLEWHKMMLIGVPGAVIALIWSLIVAHGLPDFQHPGDWMNQRGNWYNKVAFQQVFLLFLLLSIANMIFGKSDKKLPVLVESKKTTALQILVSLLAGTVVALSGLGGGVIMVPLFRMILKMPMRKATALSLSIIPLLSIAPLFSYLTSKTPIPMSHPHTGYLVWFYALPIAAAVMLFANLGQRSAKYIPVYVLRIIFAVLSLTVFIKTIYDLKHS